MPPLTQITYERVDDIPLLMHLMTEKLEYDTQLDRCWPRHGNWLGLSVGQVMVTWLAHILSECTHTMSPVRAWANGRSHMLSGNARPAGVRYRQPTATIIHTYSQPVLTRRYVDR